MGTGNRGWQPCEAQTVSCQGLSQCPLKHMGTQGLELSLCPVLALILPRLPFLWGKNVPKSFSCSEGEDLFPTALPAGWRFSRTGGDFAVLGFGVGKKSAGIGCPDISAQPYLGRDPYGTLGCETIRKTKKSFNILANVLKAAFSEMGRDASSHAPKAPVQTAHPKPQELGPKFPIRIGAYGCYCSSSCLGEKGMVRGGPKNHVLILMNFPLFPNFPSSDKYFFHWLHASLKIIFSRAD